MNLTEKIKRIQKLFLGELSKLGALRSIPFINSWYQQHVINTRQETLFLAGVANSLTIKYRPWKYAPLKFAGGPLLNLLGLQVIRFNLYNLTKMPKPTSGNEYSTLHQQGVMKIDNFIDQALIDKLNRFHTKNAEFFDQYYTDFAQLIIFWNEVDRDQYALPDFVELRNELLNNTKLKNLYEDITGRHMRVLPLISILKSTSFASDPESGNLDGQNTPHRDVFYPSYKCYIYLNDVSKDNGAFVYYPQSHRYSPKNTFSQYKNSLSHYFNTTDHKPLKESSEYAPKNCEGSAGSAVIFNVSGLHHRGSFLKDIDRERVVLLIDFRQQEALLPRKTRYALKPFAEN